MHLEQFLGQVLQVLLLIHYYCSWATFSIVVRIANPSFPNQLTRRNYSQYISLFTVYFIAATAKSLLCRQMVARNPDPLINALANVLRRHRQAAGLSQEDLAFRAGRSMRYISLLESSRHQPTLDTLKRLSDGLNIPLGRFVTEVEAEASLLESHQRNIDDWTEGLK